MGAGQRKNTSTRSIAFSAKVPWARVKISLWTTEPSHQVAVVSHKRLLCHLAARMPLLNESQWHQRQNKGVCLQARGLGIDPTAAMRRLRVCLQYQEWSHLNPLKCRSTRSCRAFRRSGCRLVYYAIHQIPLFTTHQWNGEDS